MTDSKKSYYAIIPASVRYDESLPPNAKLLYGEITALCNAEGYCWASNKYFAELYGVSIISISKWINVLVKNGYIASEIVYKKGTKQIEGRYITILYEPIKEKFNTPIKEKFKDNNTSSNNTSNNTTNIYIPETPKAPKKPKPKPKQFIPPTLEEVQAYCIERKNNVDAKKFYDYYTAAEWHDGKGDKVKSWKQKVITWENNDSNKKKTEPQRKGTMESSYEWYELGQQMQAEDDARRGE